MHDRKQPGFCEIMLFEFLFSSSHLTVEFLGSGGDLSFFLFYIFERYPQFLSFAYLLKSLIEVCCFE